MGKYKIGDKVELNFPGLYYYFQIRDGKMIIESTAIDDETKEKNIKRVESLDGFDGWIVNPSTGIIENDLKLILLPKK